MTAPSAPSCADTSDGFFFRLRETAIKATMHQATNCNSTTHVCRREAEKLISNFPGVEMSYAFVNPKAGRAGTSTPSNNTSHRDVKGTDRCTVPATTSACIADSGRNAEGNAVAPAMSVAIMDDAPASVLLCAPAAVNCDRTGTQVVFSKITTSDDAYRRRRSSCLESDSTSPRGAAIVCERVDCPPSMIGTTMKRTDNGASNRPARDV